MTISYYRIFNQKAKKIIIIIIENISLSTLINVDPFFFIPIQESIQKKDKNIIKGKSKEK